MTKPGRTHSHLTPLGSRYALYIPPNCARAFSGRVSPNYEAHGKQNNFTCKYLKCPTSKGERRVAGERIVPRANSFVCKNKAHTLAHTNTHGAAPCVMYTGKYVNLFTEQQTEMLRQKKIT